MKIRIIAKKQTERTPNEVEFLFTVNGSEYGFILHEDNSLTRGLETFHDSVKEEIISKAKQFNERQKRRDIEAFLKAEAKLRSKQ